MDQKPSTCHKFLKTLHSKSLFKTPFLDQKSAINVDVELESTFHFKMDQLIESAGYSCSQAAIQCFPLKNYPKALILVGPGNNGADALVCARWLSTFGYQISVFFPKQKRLDFFNSLKHFNNVSIISDEKSIQWKNFSFVVDGMFGFSFKGKPRAPFDFILTNLETEKIPSLAIDIPSGWDVELGPTQHSRWIPSALISLTAPKLCATFIPSTTRHFLGGRFIPPKLAENLGFDLKVYPGHDMVVEVFDSSI